jgi:hypothetical protein
MIVRNVASGESPDPLHDGLPDPFRRCTRWVGKCGIETLDSPCASLGRPLVRTGFAGCHVPVDSVPAHGRVCWRGGGTSSQKGSALLPSYTTGIIRIRSNLHRKLGRVIGRAVNGELQIEGARRSAIARQEARADSASRSSCRRIDS